MSRTVDFAYAGARIQARYGRLVPPQTWERLHRLDTADAFLQAARDTPLRPWLLQIDPGAGVHQIEAQLRTLFRRRIEELRGWAPVPWRTAIDWVAVLADLPAIAGRLRGGDAPWQRGDSRLGRVPAGGDAARLPEPLRGVQQALAAKRPAAESWLQRWRSLWPETLPVERRGLERLIELLQGAARAAAHDAAAAQATLLRPLQRLFRRETRAPAGLFAYLALTWIEFAAVRGALVRRRLALPPEGAAA